MVVFISKVNNYMFRPKAAIFRLLQFYNNPEKEREEVKETNPTNPPPPNPT